MICRWRLDFITYFIELEAKRIHVPKTNNLPVTNNNLIKNKTDMCVNALNNKPNKRLLTFCDEKNKNIIHQTIKTFVANDFSCLTYRKPGAQYNQVTNDVSNLAKDFNLSDYILISAGTNDFLNRKYPSFKHISNMVQSCPNANFIFAAVLQFSYSKYLNNKMDKFNSALKNFVYKLDYFSEGFIHFVDTCNPEEAASKIKDITNQNFKVNNNLKYIDRREEEYISRSY